MDTIDMIRYEQVKFLVLKDVLEARKKEIRTA